MKEEIQSKLCCKVESNHRIIRKFGRNRTVPGKKGERKVENVVYNSGSESNRDQKKFGNKIVN